MKPLMFLLCMCSLSHAVLIKQTVRRADGTTYTRIVEKPDDYQPMAKLEQSDEIDGYYVVARDPVAYRWALREARILASRGTAGHPLGCAPGTRMSGTGYGWNPLRPNHCYLGELPHSRLVARARVRGPNGAWFWSAHYR